MTTDDTRPMQAERIKWSPDHLGKGFEMTRTEHPADYSGPVRSTTVRRRAKHPTGKAVLYVH